MLTPLEMISALDPSLVVQTHKSVEFVKIENQPMTMEVHTRYFLDTGIGLPNPHDFHSPSYPFEMIGFNCLEDALEALSEDVLTALAAVGFVIFEGRPFDFVDDQWIELSTLEASKRWMDVYGVVYFTGDRR